MFTSSFVSKFNFIALKLCVEEPMGKRCVYDVHKKFPENDKKYCR